MSTASTSTTQELYDELTTILSTRDDNVLDIEILPPGFPPLLHDGLNVGISKKALVQVFLIARKIFASRHSLPQGHSSLNQVKQDFDVNARDGATDKALRATEVILLFDPEHLTACNWRKKRLVGLKREAAANIYSAALHADLTFTTTLLRSPLNRHAKSPTIWHHRRWILTELLSAGQFTAQPPLRRDEDCARTTNSILSLWHSEISTALLAGVHHPGNYYAFTHLRRLLPLLIASQNAVLNQHVETTSSLVLSAIPETHAWCLKHPRDISGWSFLLWLMEGSGDAKINEAVARTAEFAGGLKWEGESLWWFLLMSKDRGMLGKDVNAGEGEMTVEIGDFWKGGEILGGSRTKRWEALKDTSLKADPIEPPRKSVDVAMKNE